MRCLNRAALWSVLTAGVLAAAQDARPGAKSTAGRPDYVHPEEVAVLSAQFSAVLQPPEGAAPAPDDLIQLSRLLAEPCDQLRWLLSQVQIWAAAPAQRRGAGQIARAALERGQSLANHDLLKECSDALSALQDVATRLEAADELTNPDALQKRLQQAESLKDLEPFAKFALLARGAPAARLFSDNVSEDWDAPRLVMNRLAGVVDLPLFGELHESQQRLAATYGLWTAQAVPAFNEQAQQQLATATFQVAAAYLDRALGLDATDRAALKAPIPYNDSPAEWAKLAAAFDQDALRTWATLARILAASPPPGKAASAADLSAARDVWADVRKVSAEVWPTVDNADNGWLVRLADAGRVNSPRMLPLGQTFNASRSAQRRQYENEVVTLLRAPRNEAQAERLLSAIQSAKIAELGLSTEIKPIDLKALKTTYLGGDADNWVYLFVEMIELKEAAPQQGGAFAGVALYRTEYAKRTADSRATDRYEIKILPQSASPEELIQAALAAPGPPLVGNGQIRKDARILLAPDGVLPASWFAFERQTLLQPTEWTRNDPSWVVYLPSAAALGADRWSLDETLRAWYRSAVRTEHTVPALVGSAAPFGTSHDPGRPLNSPMLGPPIFCVWMDKGTARPEEQLFDFMAAKREAEVRAIPLWVSKGPRKRS